MEKRITIKVTEKFHKEVKQRALDRGVTITRYVHNAIWKQIQKELKYECQAPDHEPQDI
jgi:predicted DNA binding CopG/RHH family protein